MARRLLALPPAVHLSVKSLSTSAATRSSSGSISNARDEWRRAQETLARKALGLGKEIA